MTTSPSLSPSLDDRLDKIADFLFGFQPPANRGMPTIDWDLFAIDWKSNPPKRNWRGLLIGEALSGLHKDPKVFIWPEVSHIDLMLGRSDGNAGIVFGNALANQQDNLNNLLAIVNPNLAVKPATVLVTKCKTNSRERANQMFGPAQSAVADAMVDCTAHGFFPEEHVDDLVCVAGIFIDPNAGAAREKVAEGEDPLTGKVLKNEKGIVMATGEDAADSNHRIYVLNYVCTVAAVYSAMTGGRSLQSIIEKKIAGAEHVLRGFKPKP